MKVAAIVPAYNEEKTIGVVLAVLKRVDILNDIIVVDDGSRDATAEYARAFGVRVIKNSRNCGKGASLERAAKAASDADILVFVDADLVGLQPFHIMSLVYPLLHLGHEGMVVGFRDRGNILTWLMMHCLPAIGGERALRREIFCSFLKEGIVPDFGVEIALNAYCAKHRIPVVRIALPGVSHIIKERKYGFWVGFFQRARMVWQIIRSIIVSRALKVLR